MVLPAAVLGNPGFTPSAGRWSIRLFGVGVCMITGEEAPHPECPGAELRYREE